MPRRKGLRKLSQLWLDAAMAEYRKSGLSGASASGAAKRRAARFCPMLVLAIPPTGARTATIDTEHLFGFTIGSDVGEVGEREIESSATGRFGKQTGTYNAASGTRSEH